MRCGERDDARNEIFRQLWHLLGDAIQQLLRLLTTKQLCGMLANEVVKMRCFTTVLASTTVYPESAPVLLAHFQSR